MPINATTHIQKMAPAAGGQGDGDAGQVAGADARRQRGTQRPKEEMPALSLLLLFFNTENMWLKWRSWIKRVRNVK